MTKQTEIVDDLDRLLEVLPQFVRETLEEHGNFNNLIEVVLDLGRRPEARYSDGFVYLSENEISREHIDTVLKRVGEFGLDNRAGIERTLHRISAIRNRQGEIIGLTCRVGRAVFGTIDIIRDVIETGKSILLLGKPGVGKTTMLREIARVLADEFLKRVVIVDTSNEIAGDGDIPHPAIGRARRMQVPRPADQAAVMIEAVENHMPEAIIIDEIGTEAEAQAARTIAERGVQLIGTAHGITLDNLVLNPTLSDLIGGIQAVTLGDEEARRRGTQKTVLERKAPPTFEIVVEIQSTQRLAIHHDVAKTVDLLLRGVEPRPEIRERSAAGEIKVVQQSDLEELHLRETREARAASANSAPAARSPVPKAMRVFPYAVSRNRLEKAIAEAGVPLRITNDLSQADFVLTIKGQYRKMPKRLREAEARGKPVYVLRSNTKAQMQEFVSSLLEDEEAQALMEAERAVHQVQLFSQPVELSPQNAYIRRLQHQLIEKFNLQSTSVGDEPQRRVKVLPVDLSGEIR
ncbi:MAG TPA: AAA family ATPase [Firmicutes bacterium]|nr:AAA family ATPase [Bacillota bacterium]